MLATVTTFRPVAAAIWMATAPILLAPPQTSTDLPVDGVEKDMGNASVSFLNSMAAAVEMPRGRTDAWVKLMFEGILETTSALHVV